MAGNLTNAEANNERATLHELGEALDQAGIDACQAGIPAESVARMMVTTGILAALEAGVRRHGIHDIHRWLEHCCKLALDASQVSARPDSSDLKGAVTYGCQENSDGGGG